MATLTPKQQAFIEHYLVCWNASEAARRAGYSEKTAGSQGSRLLKDVEVARALDARMGELKMSANEAMMVLTNHARGTLDDFVDEFGVIDLRKAKEARKLGLVKKYKVSVRTSENDETVTTEIELHDPQNAAMLIGKHHGVFIDRSSVENTGKVEQTIRLDLSGVSIEQLRAIGESLKD